MFAQITQETFSMPVCIIGPLDDQLVSTLHAHIQSLGMTVFQNSFDFFDVASALELARQLSQQSDNCACLIYSIYSTNKESQNTLLKSLEDYSGTMPIVLHIPYSDIFLPTILSRCFILDTRTNQFSGEAGGFDWQLWLSKSPDDRIQMLIAQKDTITLPMIQAGVDFLEMKFHPDLSTNPVSREKILKLQIIREWLASPQPSLSMIGDYMSIMF